MNATMRVGARGRAGLAAILVMLALAPMAARSQEPLSPDAQKGLELLSANCSRCHAILKAGGSPLRAAPPFRTLHLRYPVESLEESLAEGIVTGHPAMPEFSFTPEQVGDIIAYLKSLER
jgi:cytochrome c